LDDLHDPESLRSLDFVAELFPGEAVAAGAETYAFGGITDAKHRNARFCNK
jgi:hypothetical protein